MFRSCHARVVALIAADCLLLYGVWALVVYGYHLVGLGQYEPVFYLRMWPIGPAFVGFNHLFRLYHGSLLYPAAPLSPVEELRRLIGASLFTHLGALAVLTLAYQTTEGYSRFVIAASGILVAALAQPFRDLVRYGLLRFGIGRIPVFVAGSGEVADRVVALLAHDAYVGFQVVDRFGDDRLRDIVPEAKRRNVRVLVACQDIRLFQCQMADYAQWFSHIEYMPTSRAFPVLGARAVSFGGLGGIEMVNQGRMRVLRWEKWLLDKTLAIFAFAVLSPFFVLLPLLIKLTSRGPVFYRQERLGKEGRPIRVWKFRSMYADADRRLQAILSADPAAAAEWAANFKLARDPRITPLGVILRRTSLDELPQLFNVFAGEMALIGPRPIVLAEKPFYGDAYRIFASVKPGVTGLWQVSGRSQTDYGQRVALDTYYVLNWSPWLDLWILFRTVIAVISMRGAC